METEANKVEVKLTHHQKRLARFKKRFFNEEDIKYQGPLSYRALRILAWIFLACGQVVMCFSVFNKMVGWNPLAGGWKEALNVLANLSTPFFIIASFGLALSGHRKARDFMLTYGLAYLGIGLGFLFFYLRYVNGLFVELGVSEMHFVDIFETFVSDRVQVNVFADLFAFALFHFFLNFTPKKVFKGKALIIFRLFALIPIAFVLTSYILKILGAFEVVNLSLYVYPFLTTKSPLVFMVFIVISLWIKYRERLFLRLGATKEEFQKFLNTNRNAFSVSAHLSLVILMAALLDVISASALLIIYACIGKVDDNFLSVASSTFGAGQAFSMLIAVPFILLYSYKRKHKDQRVDIIIPLGGVALVVLTYIECIYQFILYLLNH